MKVLFLCNNVSGVNFWRMYQYQQNMKSKGIDAVIYKYDSRQKGISDWELGFEKDKQVQDEVFTLMQNADVVIMGYAHVPYMIALIAMFQGEKNLRKPILCEIDDDIMSTPDYNPAYRQGWVHGSFNERCVVEHVKMSDMVITSTPYLGNICRKLNPKITTIPNCIDFSKWTKVSNNGNNKRVRIGWIGGGNHDEDFRILEFVVPEVLKRCKNSEFVFVHGVPAYIKEMAKGKNSRVKIVKEWVEIDKYPEHVANQGFDIGIAPLIDNKFNRAKSNLKWLEYSAVGIPSVCSNIEPYKNSIFNAKNGYLCNNAVEWVDNLEYLVKREDKRKILADNAYKSVKSNYNLDIVTNKYIDVLREITNDKSGISSRNKKVA